jgi:hypothetical protein
MKYRKTGTRYTGLARKIQIIDVQGFYVEGPIRKFANIWPIFSVSELNKSRIWSRIRTVPDPGRHKSYRSASPLLIQLSINKFYLQTQTSTQCGALNLRAGTPATYIQVAWFSYQACLEPNKKKFLANCPLNCAACVQTFFFVYGLVICRECVLQNSRLMLQNVLQDALSRM